MENFVDIYFDANYGKLYEKMENGFQKIFEYEDENGKIVNQFILREIPYKVDECTYYDIISPYGYGGPIITELHGDKEKLVLEFEKAFSNYCEENKIISEFVRFHPIINNAIDFKNVYNSIYMRKTLGTNLKDYDDPFQNEFSKSSRKTVRQVLKSGVEYAIEISPENLDEFKRIYYLNMERKEADEFYFFDDEYFNMILKYYKENIILVKAIYEEKIIAAGLYFIYNGIIHAHLSGTDTEYLNLSPAYVLKYATVIWGKENGYKLIHYGGGLSNSEEDSLYVFKRKFSQNTDFDFYIGKKIWNKDIYKKLCEVRNVVDDGFFPAYRKNN